MRLDLACRPLSKGWGGGVGGWYGFLNPKPYIRNPKPEPPWDKFRCPPISSGVHLGISSGVHRDKFRCPPMVGVERRQIGNLLPNNRRQRRTCYALCHILYPVSAAHTSIFRMKEAKGPNGFRVVGFRVVGFRAKRVSGVRLPEFLAERLLRLAGRHLPPENQSTLLLPENQSTLLLPAH